MTLAQLEIEREAGRTIGKRKRRTKAMQTELPIDGGFRLIMEEAKATEFVEPVTPERAAELFDQLRAEIPATDSHQD